jgi:hypothetical protein
MWVKDWLLPATVSFLLVFVSLQGMTDSVIDRKLQDGSVMELGRYHFTFDAYEHISDVDGPKVIFLGSSKMREAADGHLFETHSVIEDAQFFNLAYASERPYMRMLELESLISAEPDVLVMEVGPNSFSAMKTPLSEVNAERMNALLYHRPLTQSSEFLDHIVEEDLTVLDIGLRSKLNGSSTYGFQAIENALVDRFGAEETGWGCEEEPNNVRCVPSIDSHYYESYLRQPPQFSNSLNRIKGQGDEKLADFYGPTLDKYVTSSYHNPEGVYNKNHKSYDYIINKSIQSGIKVVLVALPYNPVMMDRIDLERWDYLTEAVKNYQNREEIKVINLMNSSFFNNDVYFNDFSHMSKEGEEQFLATTIAEIDAALITLGHQVKTGSNYPLPMMYPPTVYNRTDMNEVWAMDVDLSTPSHIQNGTGVTEGFSWMVTSHIDGSVIAVLPDEGRSTKDISTAPRIEYCYDSLTEEPLWIWIRGQSPDGNSDSIWLGWNGDQLDVGSKGVQLFSKDTVDPWTGEGSNDLRIQANATAGGNCLQLWMREDGVSIQDIIISNSALYIPW